MKSVQQYIRVALSGPMRRSFVYRSPFKLMPADKGQRLLVPFGRANKVGFYLGDATAPEGIKIREVVRPLDDVSFFSGELFQFCLWMADYYFANPADVLTAALPSTFKTGRKSRHQWGEREPDYLPASFARQFNSKKLIPTAVAVSLKEAGYLKRLYDDKYILPYWPESSADQSSQQLAGYRAAELERWESFYEKGRFHPEFFEGARTRKELKDIGWTDYQISKAIKNDLLTAIYSELELQVLDFIKGRDDITKLVLNDQQRKVFETIKAEFGKGFSPFLLHGVTGSGKTLVYCKLCEEIIKLDQTALILTPEIALTGTTLAYFRAFFEDKVTVFHSGMSDRERAYVWQAVSQGKHQIVIGPRSALFAPLSNLGLIIVDEEHDSSYKQDNPSPRFHGRDSAVMRARLNNIPILLGSASPSLESYQNARSGRYKLLELTHRPAGASLPTVKMIDMRKDRLSGEFYFFAYPLKAAIEKRLELGQQIILYLNRRGYASQLNCLVCGEISQCEHCRIPLTYHRTGHRLSCHYCGYTIKATDLCPSCSSPQIQYSGTGTQKIELALPTLFPEAKISRMDSDSTSGRRRAHTLLTEFADRKQNILLGTQMVTKGLDLPGVTLVGVLAADAALNLPDFRASEKAFARLLQVSGRSGRSDSPGEVLLLTYAPENPILQMAARGEFCKFFESEIESRQALDYPPFTHIVRFILSAADQKLVESAASEFADQLRVQIKSSRLNGPVLGPNRCPMEILRGQYRYHLFVKTGKVVSFVRMLTDWEENSPRFSVPGKVKISVDVDPDDMM